MSVYLCRFLSICLPIHLSPHPSVSLSISVLFIHSFIHSFRPFLYSTSSSPPRSAPDTALDTAPEFHAEAPQATASEGLAQGPYVAARAGVEPTTLWSKGLTLLMRHNVPQSAMLSVCLPSNPSTCRSLSVCQPICLTLRPKSMLT